MSEIRRQAPPQEWGVAIDPAGIEALAAAWRVRRLSPPAFDYPGLPSWHDDRWLDFCVIGCSIIACLWPPEGEATWETEWEGTWLDDAPGLFSCFARLPTISPSMFSGFDRSAAEKFFTGRGVLQLLEERARRLAEVAGALIDTWEGSARNLVEAAGWDGPTIVEILVETVPGYRDEADTTAGMLRFNKLAHLCAAMISSRSCRPITRLHTFPVYPDYMLPRFLRHHGILRYAPELADMVDGRKLVAAGSEWEHAIRWATVFAADRLAERLQQLGNPVTVPALDYAMWHASVLGPEAGSMGEHHRTLTMSY